MIKQKLVIKEAIKLKKRVKRVWKKENEERNDVINLHSKKIKYIIKNAHTHSSLSYVLITLPITKNSRKNK